MLTASQIDHYHREGYISGVPVMSAEAAAGYLDHLERFEREHGDRARHLLRSKTHLILTWADELMRHPRLLEAVSDILGPDVLCWLTSFFIKNERDPHFVSWHQDSNYWGLDSNEGVISAWVALTPSQVSNGCMRIIPRSHTRIIEHRETDDPNNMLTRGQTAVVDDSDAVDIVLEPGEICLFHPLAVHGSNPNSSGERRIGYAMRYIVPERRQVVEETDSVALVLGEDRFGHFEHEPRPSHDLAPEALAVQDRVLGRKHGGLYMKNRQRQARQ
ncbi:MAG: phytanoyl-CoA dioxygenase family protein [Gammaproteobacteria bacterium]|nr:phytanoyl-CoA dioxygenase family protein [Gammaproteobacteria bacterium]